MIGPVDVERRGARRTRGWLRAVTTVTCLLILWPPLAAAQPKTDVVILNNGDRITGEIKKLDRGRLEFSTDDAGTLYLEWDNLVAVVTTREMEVATAAGTRYLGPLVRGLDRQINVSDAGGATALAMADVTSIVPIGSSFWRKLDGSVDVGFSYTQSSGISQLNVNSDTVWRTPGFLSRLTGAVTNTTTEDGGNEDDRAYVVASYRRDRARNWFVGGAARFENNESLGLKLRSEIGFTLGPRLVNSNSAYLTLGAGLAVNNEQYLDAESTDNVEAMFAFDWSYFTYDRPKTNYDLSILYYTSLSDPGRRRVQLNAAAKREIFADFFVSFNVYNSYDSRPPDPEAETNDVGVVLSIGWTY